MERTDELIGLGLLGALAWVGRLMLTEPERARKALDELRARLEQQHAADGRELTMLREEVRVLQQQVSGPLGLVTVVGRLADAVERLDSVLSRASWGKNDDH